jgi:hypothetical protein
MCLEFLLIIGGTSLHPELLDAIFCLDHSASDLPWGRPVLFHQMHDLLFSEGRTGPCGSAIHG